MKRGDDFKEAFEKLNENQREAVERIEGPVMVVAGPGTGKTRVLTLRIANILKNTDTSPGSILALTFTEAAAREMRERLISLIGKDGYLVRIGTFHAFCQEVIRDNPEKFLISEATQNLSDLERNEIIELILLGNDFEIIRPINSPLFYANSLLAGIRNLKREGVDPDEFEVVLERMESELVIEKEGLGKTEILKREKEIAKNKELAKVYRLYQKELSKRGRFDFEDMINKVVDAFKNDADFLLSYQEKFNYVLVDEYQDTNSAQNQLVFNLTSYWGERANIFAVGDPNQSIFRFAGTSLENFQEFVERFPKSTLINLVDNYRSSQLVLDVAQEVIGNNQTQFSQLKKAKLQAKNGSDNLSVETAFFSGSIFEDFYIAKTIKENKSRGIPFSEMVVIGKQNQDLKDLASFLDKYEVPVVIEGGEDVLRAPIIKRLLRFLKVIDQTDSGFPEIDLFTILYDDFLGLEGLEVVKLIRKASEKKRGLIATLLETEEGGDFHELAEKLARWKKEEKNSTFMEFFSNVLEESGFLNYVLSQNEVASYLNQINSLFDEIKRQSAQYSDLNLSRFLKNIELMEKQNISVSEKRLEVKPEAVTLTTVHKAKGREWREVYIYRFVDGKWGNIRSWDLIKIPKQILKFGEDEVDPNEEERRLFYVALTRAKEKVNITGAGVYETAYGEKECLSAMFLSEVSEKNLKKIEIDEIEEKSSEIVRQVFASQPKEVGGLGEEVYLKELVANFKMSVTALDTYLTCPYKFKLNNLYRIPQAKEDYLAFGTSVHKALELFHQRLAKEKKTPDKVYLLEEFERAIEREILTEESLLRRKKQGQKILSAYYDFYRDEFKTALATEKYFGYASYSRIMLDDIPLAGKIDRIEAVDETGVRVRVVDYKTGKPKSRNEIEGKTKYSTGSYKRQLVFYQILSDLDSSFKPKMVEAELDFVEPDERGGFKKERFAITDKEVSELKKIIKGVMAEIRALKFPRTSDSLICASCDFAGHCWPEGIPKTSNQNNPEN
jgi:DNA helicase II / ATP-dependent DNA helicase PcrA